MATAPEPTEPQTLVIQADRDAAMRMLNHAFRNAPSDCTVDVDLDDIARAFATHRVLFSEALAEALEMIGTPGEGVSSLDDDDVIQLSFRVEGRTLKKLHAHAGLAA